MTKYRDLAARLRSRIGPEFAVGDRLPVISRLQAEYDIRGLNTVREALRVLADEGLVRIEHGRGSFVAALPEPRSPVEELRPDVVVISGISREDRQVLTARADSRGESLNAYLLGLITRHAAEPTVSEVLDRAARRTERADRTSLEALEAERHERDRTAGERAGTPS